MTLLRPLAVLCAAALAFNCSGSICQAAQSAASDATEIPSLSQEKDRAESRQADSQHEPSKVLRLRLDEFGNPIALETATKKFVLKNDKGEIDLEVYLESVIHIADTSYYRGFQQRFERYDAVLYELVTEQPERRPGGDDLPSGFELFQQVSTGTLGLAHQLEAIDYSPENMIHADLSPSEMADRMRDRGETKTTLLVDMMSHIIKSMGAEQPGEDADSQEVPSNESAENEDAEKEDAEKKDAEPAGSAPGKNFGLSLLTDPDGIMKLRRIMASALVDSQLLDSVFPPSIHRLLVSDRNDRVMSVLNSERKKGKRRIAIFYGAGHMADFERRLVNEYGMELAEENWRNAWDLRDGAVAGGPLEGLIESTFRDSIKEKLSRIAQGRKHDSADDRADDQDESDKDSQIKAMEKTLKELKAKIKKLEQESGRSDEKSPEDDEAEPDKGG